MPAIEFYHLEEIHPSVTGLVPNERTGGGYRSHTVNRLRDLMVTGGWTLDMAGSPKASLTVVINIEGLPVRTPEPPGGDADKANGAIICTQPPSIQVTSPEGAVTKVWGYDPGAYTEPPCPHFEFGFTPGQTYQFFKIALTGALGMNILLELSLGGGVVELRLGEPVSGPEPNGKRVGGWVNGTVWRGGWSLYSGTYRDYHIGLSFVEGPGTGGGAWDAMELTARPYAGPEDLVGGYPASLSLALSGRWRGGTTPVPPYSGPPSLGSAPLPPADPNANIGDWSWFRVCVCPYQIAIWYDGASDTPQQTESAAPRSLFLSMPFTPEGFTGHDLFVFAANSILGVFRTQMAWPAQTMFDGSPWQETGITVPCMRARHEGTVNSVDRVSNTQGAVLVENAYVCTEKYWSGYIGNHRICGKLWNCAVLAQTYPCATVEADMLDGKWIHVSSHGWAKDYSALPGRGVLYGAEAASVWWKVDS